MKLPASRISDKVQAYGVSSAAVVLLVWIAGRLRWDINTEVATAMVGLIGFAFAYFTEERAYGRRAP